MNPWYRRRQEWTGFQLYAPMGAQQKPEALHRMLQQFWARSRRWWWQRLVTGQPWLSYEIRAAPGRVDHLWVVPRALGSFIRQELAEAYRPCEPEPADLVPLLMGSHSAGALLRLRQPACYGLAADRPGFGGDLVAALGGLQPGEAATLQLLLIPLHDGEWKPGAHREFRKASKLQADGSALTHVGGSWTDEILAPVDEFFGLGGQKKATLRRDVADAVERAMLKEAPAKLRDHAFEVMARVVATAPVKARAVSLVHAVTAQFAALDDSNQVVPGRAWMPRRLWNLVERRWPTFTGDVWTCGELAAVVAAPGPREENAGSRVLELRVPPPEKGVRIGYAQHRGQRVEMRVPVKAFFEHMLIAGRTGKGKGVDQLGMCMDMAELGMGFTWLFPLRRDAYTLMSALPEHRLKDVVFFEIGHPRYALPLNILANDSTPEDQERAAREALNLFARLFADGWGHRSAMLFRMSLAAAAAVGGHVGDAERVLQDPTYAAKCGVRVHNPSIRRALQGKEEWGSEVEAPLNKYADLTMGSEISAMLCQPDMLNWRDVVLRRRIVIGSLNQEQLGDLPARTAAGAIVNALLRAVKSIPHDQREHVAHVLGLDEFKIVTGEKTASFWEEGFSQARQFKLGIVPAIQYPEQIPDNTWEAMKGNIGSAIVMGQRGSGARDCLEFLGDEATVHDLTRQPSLQAIANVQIETPDRSGRATLTQTGPFTLFAPEFLKPVRDGFEAAEASMATWLRPLKTEPKKAEPAAPVALEVD